MAIESIGQSLASKITELLVEPAISQLRYMFCFNSFVQEVREQKENLILAQDRVQNAVKVAKNNGEEIEKDVEMWLKKSNMVLEDVKALENDVGKDSRCFKWFPNWIRRWKLGRNIVEKTDTLKELQKNSQNFHKVAHKAPVRSIDFLPSTDFIPAETSKEAFKQIMDALEDVNVNKIGLYGMGGVGKTTLVTEVWRKAKDLKLFHKVLMVALSQTPNLKMIQDQIADNLGLTFTEQSVEGRASRLLAKLTGDKEEEKMKVLIILDDAWEGLCLKDIGIPFHDDDKSFKILLTTRLQHVCDSMKCQRKIHLKILCDTEAWNLFKISAGLTDDSSALNNVAMEVARECKGLPIAIVTLGKALRGKTNILEWKVASQHLKSSQLLEILPVGKDKNAYACLKMSYDYLNSQTKLCLLLCSLFPEDCEIPIEDLTRYAVGWGLYQDFQSIEEVRDQIFVKIEDLKACSLLLETGSKEHVKVHDMVRDVALWITCKEKNVIKENVLMVKAGIGLKEWPRNIESFEDYTVISLMENSITELPDGLVCQQLKVFLLGLSAEDGMKNVPDTFFKGMKALNVLSLGGGCLSLLSFEFLTNLKTLELKSCKCSDLASLGKLKKLKILSFHKSSITELPDELGEVKSLELLDLTSCTSLERIPMNLIARLKNLEELYIGDDSFKQWKFAGTSQQSSYASLTELDSLPHLAILSLKLEDVESIPRDTFFSKLQKWHKYAISIGRPFQSRDYPTSRSLALNIAGFPNIFPSFHKGGFENLITLELCHCDEMEYLVDTTQHHVPATAFSSLTTLELLGLKSLRCIWKGPTQHAILQNLVHLSCHGCLSLKSIFPESLTQNMFQLRTLTIRDCSDLEYIFPLSMAPRVLNLEQINIEHADKLKQVFGNGEDVIAGGGIGEHAIVFPRLRELKFQYAPNLSNLGPKNLVAELPSLQCLWIRDCAGNLLEQVQGFMNLGKLNKTGDRHELLLSRLEDLFVRNQLELRYIWNGPTQFVNLNNLKKLVVVETSLRHLFPLSLARSLRQLAYMSITWCDQMEEIIFKDVEVEDQKCFPNLNRLILFECNKLKSLFPVTIARHLTQLVDLSVCNASQLEELFVQEDEAAISKEEIVFPKLDFLNLEGLPNLLSFCQGGYHFTFPSLKPSKVNACPNISSRISSIAVNCSFQDETEILQVVED